jgi:hypothetical protein
MPDRIPVSAADLAAALTEFRIGDARYDGQTKHVTYCEDVPVTVRKPATVAKALHATLARQHAEFPPEDMPSRFADPEARALAAIVDRLAELEAETDGDAVQRVVRYLHRRYRDE